jgi:hypothetical protein
MHVIQALSPSRPLGGCITAASILAGLLECWFKARRLKAVRVRHAALGLGLAPRTTLTCYDCLPCSIHDDLS